ncbi:MAG: hypothetical protein M0Q38_04100 [Bacteroidales bacterium]|jgi:uncharacterized protein YjgD (DUF1641 family)|nr:hypothetical protein [Bacteroidales bacterium]
MADQDIQIQISELNRKLDLILENAEQQKRTREEFDDLVADLNIVAKDAFQQTVVMLDKSQVELDHGQVSALLIKLIQNLDTFHEMLDMLESARDFLKDLSPVLHQMGLDAVNKMNELDQKGYFEYAGAIQKFVDKFVQTFTAKDLRKMEGSMDNMVGIIRNITDPELLDTLNCVTRAIREVKVDDNLDNVSLWKIFKQMRSKEVRKSLSYSIRLLQTINKS